VAPSERAQGQRLVRAISAHLADGTLRKAFVDLTRKFIMQEGARVRATKAQAHLNAGGIDGFTGLGGMFCLDGVGLAGIAGGAGGDSMFPTLYCDEAVGTDELWAPDECLDDSLGPPLAFEGIPSNGSGAYTGGYMGGYMGGRGGGGGAQHSSNSGPLSIGQWTDSMDGITAMGWGGGDSMDGVITGRIGDNFTCNGMGAMGDMGGGTLGAPLPMDAAQKVDLCSMWA
jgi:hypothetical protein